MSEQDLRDDKTERGKGPLVVPNESALAACRDRLLHRYLGRFRGQVELFHAGRDRARGNNHNLDSARINPGNLTRQDIEHAL